MKYLKISINMDDTKLVLPTVLFQLEFESPYPSEKGKNHPGWQLTMGVLPMFESHIITRKFSSFGVFFQWPI